MNVASQKTAFTKRTLLALLTEQAELAKIPGELFERSPWPNTEWISYPASRAAIEETIATLIRSLANAHGIPASYPPMG